MTGDMAESIRRQSLATEFLKAHPAKASVLRKTVADQVFVAYLSGYQQACVDLLSPKDTPGVPATAVTLLNRVGEMVLKNRAELLKMPVPRLQCPGCFCMLPEDEKDKGWCHNCEPHKEQLIIQVSDRLRPTQEDGTLGAGGVPEQLG